MQASRDGDRGDREAEASAGERTRALLSSVDGLVRDAQLHDRFGDLGRAFSTVLGSWVEPIAAATRGVEPTARSRAAAGSFAELARLVGEFARDAAPTLARGGTDDADPGAREGYADLAARVDDSFREFSSSPGFDRARRRAAAALLDWLEHDPATAAAIARTLEPPTPAWPRPGGPGSTGPEVVTRDGATTLARYRGAGTARASVLVVPGFTSSADLFDLDPERSVVRTLAGRGVDAWLLDWGDRGDEAGRRLTVADRIARIDGAVDTVRAAANGAAPALAGHFHGGLLALLHCIRHPGKAGALVTLSTPVDFASTGDVFADWLRACDGERLADVFGNVPGALVAALLAAAAPMQWCGGGFFTLLDGVDATTGAARIARFERARRFPPAFPGETFRGLCRAFYRDNPFIADGAAVIDGRRYDLSTLATPVMNVLARDDRIVPPSASTPLGALAKGAPRHALEHDGGHFDLLTGRDAHRRLLPDLADWLTGHDRGA